MRDEVKALKIKANEIDGEAETSGSIIDQLRAKIESQSTKFEDFKTKLSDKDKQFES